MRKLMTERNGLEAASSETGSGPFIAIVLAALPVVAAVMLFAGRRDHEAPSDEAAVSSAPSPARKTAAQNDAADQGKIAAAHDTARAERQTTQTAEKGDRFTRWNWI